MMLLVPLVPVNNQYIHRIIRATGLTFSKLRSFPLLLQQHLLQSPGLRHPSCALKSYQQSHRAESIPDLFHLQSQPAQEDGPAADDVSRRGRRSMKSSRRPGACNTAAAEEDKANGRGHVRSSF